MDGLRTEAQKHIQQMWGNRKMRVPQFTDEDIRKLPDILQLIGLFENV